MSLKRAMGQRLTVQTVSGGLFMSLCLIVVLVLAWPGPTLAQDARSTSRFLRPGYPTGEGGAVTVPDAAAAQLLEERLRELEDRLKEQEALTTAPGEVRPAEPSACDRSQPSIIEKAYRIQYSDVILRHLKELDHLSPPPPIETLDKERPGLPQERAGQYPEAVEGAPPAASEMAEVTEAYTRPQVETEEEKEERLKIERDRTLDAPRTPDEEKLRFVYDPPSPGSERAAPVARFDVVEKYFTQFGYDLFIPEAFQPPTKVVPPKDYVLGPGDVLRVNLWGSGADAQAEGEIMPDGTITLPKLGVIPVAGIPYGEITGVISREAKKYIQGVNLSVTLVKPKSLEVYVLGQVCMPGLRLIPSFSTVISALAAAGGPLRTGSLRNIAVYREGKLYRHFDLYDLILKGDTRNDVLLMDKDVVHVPYIGPTVAMVGAVRHPGIFEIKKSPTDVYGALQLAGGVLSQAQVKLNIRRFQRNRALTVLDVGLYDAALYGTSVLDGDLVEIRYIGRRFPPTVKVTGHVWDTLEFEYQKGMRLSDVLPSPEQLKPDAITDYLLLYRYDFAAAGYKVERIPLKAAWDGKFGFDLKPHDEIRVLSKLDYGIKRKVYLRDGVWQPGDYDYTEGLTLRALLALGGGVKHGTNLAGVELSRQKVEKGEFVTEHKIINLADPEVDPVLRPFDTVRVPMLKDAGKIRQVSIEGEVRFPGEYTLREGEKLSDLIARAGGFLPTAYLHGAQYYSSKAREIQQKSIDAMINDLEIRLTGSQMATLQSVVSPEDIRDQNDVLRARRNFVERLRSVRALGRVTIVLADMNSFKDSSYDFDLKDGDRLVIPKRPNFVNVVGSVYSPNAYLYQPNMSLGDYLDMSGGPAKTADDSYIYVVKADGSVVSKKQRTALLLQGFYNMKMMPGDTIVVPEDFERIPTFRIVKDIGDILYKIAIATGVWVNVLQD